MLSICIYCVQHMCKCLPKLSRKNKIKKDVQKISVVISVQYTFNDYVSL